MTHQLHISQLLQLGACGEKYYRRYVLGHREPGRTAPLIGTVAHEAARFTLRRKIDTGALPTSEEVADVTADDFNARWTEEEIALTEEERAKGATAARGSALDLAVNLSTLHLAELAPKIHPIDVEWRWVLQTPYGIELAGTTDVREETLGQDMLVDPEPRLFRTIRDFKTRGKRTTQLEADTSIQLTIYDLAETVITGVKPDLVFLDTIVKPTQKRAAFVDTKKAVRIEADYTVLAARLERGIKVLESGAFSPANLDEWYCSAAYCGFHLDGSCPFVRHPVQIAPGGIDAEKGAE